MPGYPNVGEGMIRTHDLLEHLRKDVGVAFATLEADKSSQYLRRCAARAVFSFVESLVSIVKVELQSEVRSQRSGPVVLSAKEDELLYERRVIDGISVPAWTPLEKNLKATFRLAAKLWGLSNYKLDTRNENYRDFLAAKNARNRLTHPRTYYDIVVTDVDMHCYGAVEGPSFQSRAGAAPGA